ncbi:MAG: outer membrane beta-barrel protein [Planctomycetota bacterium]|jgi:hypothetical protein
MKAKGRNSIKLLLLICLGLFVWVPSVFAVGNIHIGRLEINPEISYGFSYNDNIFFENEDEQDDYVHALTPGVVFKISETSEELFSAGYNVGIVRYSEFDEVDYEDHRAFVTLGYKTPKGFYVRGSNHFQDTADPYGSEQEFRIGDFTPRWNNLAELHAGYEFAERYGIEGIYKYFKERYDLTEDKYRDRSRHTYGGALFYRVTGKSSLFGQYLRYDIDYDSQNRGIFTNGVEQWNSTNSHGELKFGYGTIDFANNTDKNGNPYNDDDFWIMKADIGYRPREKTNLSLILSRSKHVSTSADRINDVSATYLRTDVEIRAEHNFTHRISMNLGFKWSYKDYLDVSPGFPEKDFNIYRVNCGVNYNISDWIIAGLEYKYWDNRAGDSQYSDENYTVNSVGIDFRFMF